MTRNTAIFLLALLASISLTRCGGGAEADPVIPSVRNLIRVPLARQAKDYTCGVAALQSVLGFYGDDIRQDELEAAVGSTPDAGTNYLRIEQYAREHGYDVTDFNNMTPDDLKGLIDSRLPLIILIQAWPSHSVDWATDIEDGHYVVAVGYDAQNFYFMDPSTLGHYTYIPAAEFPDRWHDANDQGPPFVHFGMLITRGSPSYNPEVITPLN